ncbi:uncharacterized protein [Triticum aestivum]|uniref:uncharacterized protein isoform X2 n=1 Tax=Triticum aestivum TaxID=4565 RepID=UPI001D00C990|nr:uncharacterized protein LOC123088448 isoform X2 [Triticum aestivum]
MRMCPLPAAAILAPLRTSAPVLLDTTTAMESAGTSSRRHRCAGGIFLPHVHPVLLMNPLNIPSSGRHFYLAVDRLQFKMRTLLELLGVVSDRHGSVPIAICVSSRDELDAVCAAVANLPFVSLSPLYSDQDEAERASVLEKSRRAAIQRNQIEDTSIGESPKPERVVLKLNITVVTDACLPSAAMGEAPLMSRVLINYELPTKKMES